MWPSDSSGLTLRWRHVNNELSGLASREGQTLPPHQELSIRVLVKDQAVWRIAAFHNTILQK